MLRETFRPGGKVYFYHPKTFGWCIGTVNNVTPEGKVVVDDPLESRTVTIAAVQCHNVMDGAFDPTASDLLSMSDLHPSTLLYCIKERFEKKNHQYTRMGDMIISVNPFEMLQCNLEKAMKERIAAGVAVNVNVPHCWEIAHTAFQRIVVNDRGNQSILISGESGAGKTETAKTLMTYLGALAASHGCNPAQMEMANKVNAKLRATNPILEAFGNAKTVRNDNSSRFGKYIKLYFHAASGAIVGAQMETYLLEKSRIVSQSKGERNYHIFYAFLGGTSASDKASKYKGLTDAQNHTCLKQGGVFTHKGGDGREVNEKAMFDEVVDAFQHVGVTPSQLESVWKLLAAIIHLQDVTFDTDPSTNVAKVTNEAKMQAAAEMLNVPVADLTKSLLVRSQTKVMTNYCNKKEAEGLRDGVSKAIYNCLFDWLVAIINKEISPTSTIPLTQLKYVGILDIFGFEKFVTNSFEQLCINYANEGLQGHYNSYTFKYDAEECKREGIACPIVEYPDNQPCIDMIEDKKGGIFALLDEECSYKLGTDKNFTERTWSALGSKPFFIQPKGTTALEFGVRHYASDVTYTTDRWIEKNLDTLKEDSKQVLLGSRDPSGLLPTIMANVEAMPADGVAKKRETVCGRFRGQLRSLLEEMQRSESQFVRCIKPNPNARPKEADNAYVGMQLECAGVLQTIAMKRQGYPVRQPHALFFSRYKLIAPKQHRKVFFQKGADVVSGSKTLLQWYSQGFKWKAPHSDIGHSKVFMKAFVYDVLERCRQLTARRMLKRVVPYLKRWIAKFRAKKAEEERRRKEELKRLQEQKAMDPKEAERIAKSSGLTPQKAAEFTKAAGMFPHFDPGLIMDVVGGLPTLEKAIAKLMEMQETRVANAQTDSLKLIYAELKMTAAQQEALIRHGIISQDILFRLTPDQMTQLGLSKEQADGLLSKILAQRSQTIVKEKLSTMYGNVSLDQLVSEIAKATQQQGKPCPVCNAIIAPNALEAHVNSHFDGSGGGGGGSRGPAAPSGNGGSPLPVAPGGSAVKGRPAPPPVTRPGTQPSPQPSQGPPPSQRPPAAGGIVGGNILLNAGDIQKIVDMGFTREQAVQALTKSGGDVRVAFNFL
eukprot:PhF_6_TR42655/c0_g1_i1/m.64247